MPEFLHDCPLTAFFVKKNVVGVNHWFIVDLLSRVCPNIAHVTSRSCITSCNENGSGPTRAKEEP